MARRIVVLSDIHSNGFALERVLEDVDNNSKIHGAFDTLLCAGDLVGYGPEPNRVIEMIRDRQFHTVMGNHDKAIFTGKNDRWKDEAKEALRKNKEALTPENLAYLASLPETPYIDPHKEFA